jgi:hypothetical protein
MITETATICLLIKFITKNIKIDSTAKLFIISVGIK